MSTREIIQDNGVALEASFGVESIDGQLTIIFESKGGARGTPDARNPDYQEGFELLLKRLKDRGARILDATVESREAQRLPIEERRLNIEGKSYPISIDDPHELRISLGAAQALVARRPGARRGGNPTRRVRLVIMLPNGPHSEAALEAELAGVKSPPHVAEQKR